MVKFILNFIISKQKQIIRYSTFTFAYFTCAYIAKQSDFPSIRLAFAGSISDMSTHMLILPLDVVNTKTKGNISKSINTFQVIKNIVAVDGIKGFWRGGSSAYYGHLIGGFCFYFPYKTLKEFFKKKEGNNKLYNTLVYGFSSMLSESISTICFFPFYIVKTRMQMQSNEYNYKGILDGFRQILGKSPIKNIPLLFQGGGVSFVHGVLNYGLIFMILESSRDFVKERKNYSSVMEMKNFEYFMCSFLAGSISGAITNVLEVVTITMQMEGKQFNLKQFLKKKWSEKPLCWNSSIDLHKYGYCSEYDIYFG